MPSPRGYRFFSYGDACLIEAPREARMSGLGFEILARDGAARVGRLTTAHGAIETPAFMPVGTAGDGEGDDPRGRRRHRRPHHPRQHLPSDAAARGRAHRRAGRPAPLHELAACDPHRFRRLPGHVAGRAADDQRGGRRLPLASRRQPASLDPGALGRDPASPRRRHHDGVRRVHPLPRRARRGRSFDGADAALGRALAHRLHADGQGTASSASCRAACTPICARARRRASSRSGSTATRSAGWRSARARRRPSRWSTRRAAPPRGPAALSDGGRQARRPRRRGQARRRHVRLRRCRPAPAAPAKPSPARARSICATPATPTTPPRSTPQCRCPACTGFSRAYLHHLTKAREILASMLLTAHNLTYYADLMADLRAAIVEGRLGDFALPEAAA